MTTAFLMALLSNLVCAGGLALMSFSLTKVWRNPHLAHALWLLVLVKLLTPPLVEIPVPEFLLAAQEVNAGEQDRDFFLDLPAGQEISFSTEEFVSTDLPALPHPTLSADTRPRTDERQTFALSWAQWLLAGWSLGMLIFVGVALRRHLRLLRVIAESQPADAQLYEDAQQIGRQMGLAACPQLCVTEVPVCPLVMGGWNKQVVLLPQRLLAELSRDQARAVLAHELAHVRRSDHLVRLFEVLVLTLHWWNPLAWWTSRQLQQSQEECCDAWVAWALPEHRRTYGQTLLQTVEFLTEQQVLPIAAGTSFGRCFLERRIEMILNQTLPRKMSRTASVVALTAGVVVLPIAFTQVVSADPAPPTSNLKSQAEATNAKASIISSKPVQDSASANADFPYAVQFKQGATRFEDGDDITIQEIRGTAETFAPGNIYRIAGTYKLASHDKAMLAAYTTANNAADGRSRSLKVQHMYVDRGKGKFTLFLPMSYEGWPHVSFYPSGGGQSFGGNYFGTGDFVLKKWWGSKQKDQKKSGASKAEKAPGTFGFFVAPVNTEFQKWRLQGEDIVAYASIDGTSFIDMDTGTIDTDRFDIEALRKALKGVRKQCGLGTLKVLIEFGAASQRPEVDTFVEGALAQMGKDAGFEKVEFLKLYQNGPQWKWKGLLQADGTHLNEERLGNDALLAFPLRTPLGRYLAGGFDCFVDVPGPLPLDAQHILSDADKAALREAFKSMDLPEDATVRFHVHVQRPKDVDTIRDLPQVKKDAEFHRDAVDFLKSVGFSQVLLAVNVSSVIHTSLYK